MADEHKAPLYYLRHGKIWKRAVCTKRDETGRTFSLGFEVCTPSQYIAAETLCGFFNEADTPDPNEPPHNDGIISTIAQELTDAR